MLIIFYENYHIIVFIGNFQQNRENNKIIKISLAILLKRLHVSIFQKKRDKHSIRKINKIKLDSSAPSLFSSTSSCLKKIAPSPFPHKSSHNPHKSNPPNRQQIYQEYQQPSLSSISCEVLLHQVSKSIQFFCNPFIFDDNLLNYFVRFVVWLLYI